MDNEAYALNSTTIELCLSMRISAPAQNRTLFIPSYFHLSPVHATSAYIHTMRSRSHAWRKDTRNIGKTVGILVGRMFALRALDHRRSNSPSPRLAPALLCPQTLCLFGTG